VSYNRFIQTLRTSHRKLDAICIELDRVSRQNKAERILNLVQDGGTIAGCVDDLGHALTEYQVIQAKNISPLAQCLTTSQISMNHELLRMGAEIIVSNFYSFEGLNGFDHLPPAGEK
jgi:hypothetical protein